MCCIRSEKCAILLYSHRQLTAKTNFREVFFGSKYISITYYEVNRPSLRMVLISTRVVRTRISYCVNTSCKRISSNCMSGSIIYSRNRSAFTLLGHSDSIPINSVTILTIAIDNIINRDSSTSIHRVSIQGDVVIRNRRIAFSNIPFRILGSPILNYTVVEDDRIEGINRRYFRIFRFRSRSTRATIAILRDAEDIGVVLVGYPVTVILGNVNRCIGHLNLLARSGDKLVAYVEGQTCFFKQSIERTSSGIIDSSISQHFCIATLRNSIVGRGRGSGQYAVLTDKGCRRSLEVKRC